MRKVVNMDTKEIVFEGSMTDCYRFIAGTGLPRPQEMGGQLWTCGEPPGTRLWLAFEIV